MARVPFAFGLSLSGSRRAAGRSGRLMLTAGWAMWGSAGSRKLGRETTQFWVATLRFAMAALGLHLIGAAIWIGGLLALVAHLRGFPDDMRVAVTRFGAAALICVRAVGVSGVLEVR